jgi:hypothetical protein
MKRTRESYPDVTEEKLWSDIEKLPYEQLELLKHRFETDTAWYKTRGAMISITLNVIAGIIAIPSLYELHKEHKALQTISASAKACVGAAKKDDPPADQNKNLPATVQNQTAQQKPNKPALSSDSATKPKNNSVKNKGHATAKKHRRKNKAHHHAKKPRAVTAQFNDAQRSLSQALNTTNVIPFKPDFRLTRRPVEWTHLRRT